MAKIKTGNCDICGAEDVEILSEHSGEKYCVYCTNTYWNGDPEIKAVQKHLNNMLNLLEKRLK